ncbi:hypothetical protein FPCIR_1469 [Fusarium pseudocircinatum]|uniref:Uncharacterized protein n=1 Tax=Fusarium pseudocircinatum TaxID=56676 RepID=A0A8H5UYW1_9HYPO|nr:hypothetical protein FPCIR_1469 [Fusarium pseudocircinatum]
MSANPEKKLYDFFMKHEILWSSQWDKGRKLRLTVPLGDKNPEETLANLGNQMQREGMDKYWEYVTQAHTDDPNNVDPTLYKNDQDLQKEALANKLRFEAKDQRLPVLPVICACESPEICGSDDSSCTYVILRIPPGLNITALYVRSINNRVTRTHLQQTTANTMGAMTAKKFREWSDRWNEDFRHHYFVKKNNGYYPSLCQFASKYKRKFEVKFDNVKETLLILLPKDDYYHKDVNAQRSIKNELERAMAKEMPHYWVKDEARHREMEESFAREVEGHYQGEEANTQRRGK